MTEPKESTGDILRILREREKELLSLFQIEKILNNPDATTDEVFHSVIEAVRQGWQYPEHCQVKITFDNSTFVSKNFVETPWVLSADIAIRDKIAGKISVYYAKELPVADDGPFLKEERKLLETIAERLGFFIMYRIMKQVFYEFKSVEGNRTTDKTPEWRIALKLLRQTDKNLFLSIAHKMLNHLSWKGITEAGRLLKKAGIDRASLEDGLIGEENRPHLKSILGFSDDLINEIFDIAARHLRDEEILYNIHKWIQGDKLNFLVQVSNRNLPLVEVIDAIRRYHHVMPDGIALPSATGRGVQVALIRRFLSDQLPFINIAKNFIEISDFYECLDHIIFSPESYGKLGGKSAGLFLAKHIIRKAGEFNEELKSIKVPRTWYMTSDMLLRFISFNNLDDITEQKYKDINQIRLEYPHIVQSFKNCRFPPEVIQGLSVVLDEFEGKPLIVRSSSLLEDRMGSAFSGKYKSLFIANQGSKKQRLDELTDAIAEVYASTFGPDPIEYRAERALLDFSEEMAVMIQEVVGTKVGDYFLPLFAGVAFSRNEFRWSPRIKREDGLIRLVPGLGTRAVDRVANDYPVLIAPGQIGLRVNVTAEETARYSPRMVDVINLETNTFETIRLDVLLKKIGGEIPGINKIVSVYDGQRISKPLGLNVDFEKDELVATFEGLVKETPFVNQVNILLKTLEEKLGMPVDIEFAHDGSNFYLLQCRPQSYSADTAPSPIPADLPPDKIVFSANRYISNGRVSDITHIVYVNPLSYGELPDRASMITVGRIVSKLNKLLPKRQFILMGPGRWGSRGDITLGVNVTYSDINNTAALIEIARQKGNYTPDLSFGTHFFQDLVEADIRYIPLYPDEKQNLFNESFLLQSENILADVLPEFSSFADTVRLIDVPRSAGGSVLKILLNADLDQGVAFIAEPSLDIKSSITPASPCDHRADNNWAWRLRMAENIAAELDADRFGVKGFYIFGSTKNATAGPTSDIDILVHFQGNEQQRHDLMVWLEGWSKCLDEMNFLRTGHRIGGLLDVQIITDDDIARKTSYATKIGAVTDAARPLPIRKAQE
jgi:pyruvate,water dikinase